MILPRLRTDWLPPVSMATQFLRELFLGPELAVRKLFRTTSFPSAPTMVVSNRRS